MKGSIHEYRSALLVPAVRVRLIAKQRGHCTFVIRANGLKEAGSPGPRYIHRKQPNAKESMPPHSMGLPAHILADSVHGLSRLLESGYSVGRCGYGRQSL